MDKYIPIIDTLGLQDEGVITAEIALGEYEKLPEHIDTAVLFFDHSPAPEMIEKSTVLFRFVAASSVVNQYVYDDQIVLAFSPLGGAAAAGLIEELRAFGVNRIIACGSSGLIGEFDASKFLLVNKAIRDEGTSYHYLEASLYVETDPVFTKQIELELKHHKLTYGEGIAWTTDGFYRETKAKINLRKTQGAVAVEMECASMAAVCKYYQMPFAQILYFSDIVKQEGWSGFRTDRHAVKEIISNIVIDIACKI